MKVTASKLYNYIQCPHRVWRDEYGPQDEKIKETNEFVKLLWERGVFYEEKIIKEIGDFLDLSKGDLKERFNRTIEAMKNKTPLIYQGVLIKDDLLGIPDLLQMSPDGKYIPIDIKSGMAREGIDEDANKSGNLKIHYAAQLALYADALIRLGFLNNRQGIIYDIVGNQELYNLDLPKTKTSKTSFWQYYQEIKNDVSVLLSNQIKNKPALIGACKLCPWYNSCKLWIKESDDLSGLYNLGRSKRDIINENLGLYKIDDIFSIDLDDVMAQKKADKNFLSGIARPTLEKIIKRAKVYKVLKKPVAYSKIDLPVVDYELFFDIEDDPTQDFVYLHGVYQRSAECEVFYDFTAKDITNEAEKTVWADFWKYIRSLPKDNFSVYYYSSHEKSAYRRLQKKYPDVITEQELEDFFDNPNVIDLYGIINKYTDWPLSSYSLKSLAQYCRFQWRDKTPSGALSIQWFNEYLKTKDPEKLKRILLYNEDDCKATMVVKDKIVLLSENITGANNGAGANDANSY